MLQNLTLYSDQELSLLVFNTEYLYVHRHQFTRSELAEHFVFTNDQWVEFQDDLEIELLEAQ